MSSIEPAPDGTSPANLYGRPDGATVYEEQDDIWAKPLLDAAQKSISERVRLKLAALPPISDGKPVEILRDDEKPAAWTEVVPVLANILCDAARKANLSPDKIIPPGSSATEYAATHEEAVNEAMRKLGAAAARSTTSTAEPA